MTPVGGSVGGRQIVDEPSGTTKLTVAALSRFPPVTAVTVTLIEPEIMPETSMLVSEVLNPRDLAV